MWRKIADILFWLGVTLYLGGMLVLGVVVAPAVFDTAREQHLAMPNISAPPLEMDRQVGGEVFGNILNRFTIFEIAALVLILLGLLPRLLVRRIRKLTWTLAILWLIAAACATADIAWLRPRVWALRATVRSEAAARAITDPAPWPAREQFDHLHHLSETLGYAKAYLLLAMLLLAAWRGPLDRRGANDSRDFLRRAMGEKSNLTR